MCDPSWQTTFHHIEAWPKWPTKWVNFDLTFQGFVPKALIDNKSTWFWSCRKNFRQWQRSFQWKLRPHWLKFLRQRYVAVVVQGPGSVPGPGNNAAIPRTIVDNALWRHMASIRHNELTICRRAMNTTNIHLLDIGPLRTKFIAIWMKVIMTNI